LIHSFTEIRRVKTQEGLALKIMSFLCSPLNLNTFGGERINMTYHFQNLILMRLKLFLTQPINLEFIVQFQYYISC